MVLLNPKDIKFLIIHHTATSRDRTSFEAIKRNHINRGWGDIGYHFLITADGKLWEGRDEKFVGVHTSTLRDGISMNRQSLGICLTGNFEIEIPTKEQIATLEAILSDKRAKYSIPRTNILGHSEVGATLCPGKNLLSFIKAYRKRVEPIQKITGFIAFQHNWLSGDRILARRLNLRKEASISSPVIRVLNQGTPIKIIRYAGFLKHHWLEIEV